MDYILIRAWGQYMGSQHYYVRDMVAIAHEDKAPTNAIFKRDDGSWAKVDDIKNRTTREHVERLAAQIQARENPRTRKIV